MKPVPNRRSRDKQADGFQRTVNCTLVLSWENRQALLDEAMIRARARGKLKPDSSEVLRELIDEWMLRRRVERRATP